MAIITSVYSFADAVKVIGSKSRVRLGHNTTLQHDAIGSGKTGYVVRLHDHPIAVFHPDGLVEFSNAGWPTVTTRDRLNQLSGSLRFYQRRGVQYVSNAVSGEHEYDRSLTVTPDGFIVTDREV